MDIELKPLAALSNDEIFNHPVTDVAGLDRLIQSPVFRQIDHYFSEYPAHSLMSTTCRALLYSLVRANKPDTIAEIGTLFAGTTEVFARALWENGKGAIHTCDPDGGARCPGILAQWPEPLQAITQFYPMNSMAFFQQFQRLRTVKFDFILIDGNHDFEYALFDLMVGANMLRPGGIVIMDNAEQSGPFFATKQFLRDHAGWSEWGNALAQFDGSDTFNRERSSVAGTSFIILKAPEHLFIGDVPWSSGQKEVLYTQVSGLQFHLGEVAGAGEIQYQAILRTFGPGNREVEEYKYVGRESVTSGAPAVKTSRFEQPLVSTLQDRLQHCIHTFELEVAWKPEGEKCFLPLLSAPAVVA